jgi:uncharacterized OB-fold protein/acyl dehydratase
MAQQKEDCFVVEGKLALPYQYFAGRTGSRFLIALRDEKKIMGLRCEKCNQVFVPPRSICDTCFVDISKNWVEVQNRGLVTGFTVVRYSEPHHPIEAPYILALIKLEGASGPLAHIVQGIAPEEMRIGLAVEAVFAKETTATIRDIDHFRPVDERATESAETKGAGQAAGSPGQPGMKLGYSYDQLEVGMSASFSKTISESDVYLFAGITGDFNPVHVNEDFAKKTPFGTRIAHGGLPQCLIANVLGMQLPGLGTVALEVTTRFKKPTFFGDTITATAEVTEKLPQKRWVKMALTWTNQKGEVVCQGTALVLPPPSIPQ